MSAFRQRNVCGQPATPPGRRSIRDKSSSRLYWARTRPGSGRRRACWARHPVQCAGTSTPGFSAARSSSTRGISGSNTGPFRWNPPRSAYSGWSPVSLAGVSGDVDHARVPAAGDDHQALARHVHDQRLLVQDHRVGLPAAVQPGLLRREAGLVAGDPRHLAGDQDRALEQEARLFLLDHVEARLRQPAPAGRRHLARFPAGQHDPPPPPEVRVDEHRHVHRPEHPGQPVEPGGVVEMTVAADDDLDVRAGRAAAAACSPPCRPDWCRCRTGTGASPSPLVTVDQYGEAVLGNQRVRVPAARSSARPQPLAAAG